MKGNTHMFQLKWIMIALQHGTQIRVNKDEIELFSK